MRKVDVKLYAVEWCGYEEYYELEVPEDMDENEIVDLALDKHIQDFCDMFDLVPNGEGEYVNLGDELDDDGEEDSSTINAVMV